MVLIIHTGHKSVESQSALSCYLDGNLVQVFQVFQGKLTGICCCSSQELFSQFLNQHLLNDHSKMPINIAIYIGAYKRKLYISVF